MTFAFLIYGAHGWIGGMLQKLLKERRRYVEIGSARLENRETLSQEIDVFLDYCASFDQVVPIIINCAGVTGRPNIDWCEDHKAETIRANVIGTLNLMDLAQKKGIHVTNFATGCIYEFDAEHGMEAEAPGFKEEDKPNFQGSFYSKTKTYVEDLITSYDNVLTLRIRMPLGDTLEPRNFITKITKYAKVVNIPNSMTVLSEMLPIALDMSEKQIKGIFNFTNPGTISHNEILTLYQKYIDPDFKWTNFSLEEQAQVLKAGRSNNKLDVSKLTALYPVDEIHVATEKLFKRMAGSSEAKAQKKTSDE